MHVRLLAGYAPDAVVRAAVVVEAALKVLAGRPLDDKAMLGELIGQLHRAGKKEHLTDANWINTRRIAAVHFTGQVKQELDDDARRATEIAGKLALAAGLITELELAEQIRSAEWSASEPAGSAMLRLDRASHRKVLDDVLALPRRVLVLLVQGEVGQGHDHFSEIMTWRLRSGPKGRWKEIVINWPQPSPSLGTRLAMLYEELAHGLGVTLVAPGDADPTTPAGAMAWTPALAPVLAALDARRERLLVRHVLRWLDTGDGGDDTLVAHYVCAVWAPLAARDGQRVVVGLDLRRIEKAGLPMTKTWRASRAELAAAKAIAIVLDKLEMPREGLCSALPELVSVPAADLVEWLRTEGGRKREVAESEATHLVSSTRGGRFELVVERLTALNLDRSRPVK